MQTKEPLKPVLWIGKEGLKKGQIENIKKYLKKQRLIKVRVQKSSKDKLNEILAQILRQTNTELVRKIGFTFTLKKKGK